MSTLGYLGDLLVRAGVADAAGVGKALAAQTEDGSTLGRALARLGIAEESAVAAVIAEALRLERFDGDPPRLGDEISALLPVEFCHKRGVVPIGLDQNALRLATANPLDYSLLQDVEFRTGKTAVAVVVTETWIERALAQLDRRARPVKYDVLNEVQAAGEVEAMPQDEYDLVDPSTLAKDVQLPPIVKLVNLMLSDAARSGASDIHIEPQETALQVRQRVDGILREVLTIPHHLQDQVISRLKIISGMDIAERRKPQDGRSRLRFENRRIDLRVSTLPTQFGEKVVIRLLNADKAILPLDQLGLSDANLQTFRSLLSRPQGMVLVTGPTGSGKTSTLYAALNSIKSTTNNIISLEDPIEFQVPGINQTQVNPRAGVTFASGLRSILRQDPNVILVGEIRDGETAEIALQAAQTGHLLLSTLHTNDAPSTITRLFDLGIQPFLVASSLIGVIAQRLVRTPCRACAAPAMPSADIVERCGGWTALPADGAWTAGRGCEICGHTGLKGRLAIHEMLLVTDEVRELIASRAPDHAVRRAARHTGMRTLFEDGVEKAARGLTTLEEVLRVVSKAEGTLLEGESSGEPAPGAVSAAAPAHTAPHEEAPAARRRVLVVEDSATIMSVITYFLDLEGFDVVAAEDGRRGLELALAQPPDVIVTDVNMPAMGGLDMVRALRADPRTAGVRVLMLTSEDSVESETAGLEAGADDYILKPVEPRRLAARVKALLGRPPAAPTTRGPDATPPVTMRGTTT